MTYSETLRDPRWQKRRLEVMERDGWACRSCNATHKTLNVHHNLYYGPSYPPWDYPDALLFTLCEDCHKEEEQAKAMFDRMIALFLRQSGALNHDMHRICTLINDIGEEPGGLALIQDALDSVWTAEKKRRSGK